MKYFNFKILKRLFDFGKDDNYSKGIELYNHHQYEQAIKEFEKTIRKGLSSKNLNDRLARFYTAQSYRNLGIIRFARGDNEGALSKFLKAIQYNSKHRDLNFLAGICYNNMGAFEEAINAFSRILEDDPENLPTNLKLAITFHNMKMWDRAETINRRILERNPEYADVHFRLGLALMGQGRIPESVASFQSALNINPNYVSARIKLAIGLAYVGQFNEALGHLDIITEKFPHFSDIYFAIGAVLAEQRDYDNAISYIKKAIDINPNYKEARIKLAITYCRIGDQVAALAELRAAAALFPNDERLTAAVREMAKGEMEACADRKSASDKLSDILGSDRDLVLLVSEFNRCIDITPKFSEMLSIVNTRDSSDSETMLAEMIIPIIKEYIDKHPFYPDLHANLGKQYSVIGEFKRARNAYMEAVRLNPEYVSARIDLIKTLVRISEYSQVLDYGQPLLLRNLPYPDFYCTLAEAHLGLNDPDAALVNTARALDIYPGFLQADLLAGRAFEQKNDPEQARAEYRKCLRSNPKSTLYQSAREALERLEKG